MTRFVLIVLLFALPRAAGAADIFEGKSPQGMISEYDANGDGRLTFDELMQSLEKSARKWFRLMDRNRDGVISREDGAALEKQMENSLDWLWDMLRDLFEDEKKPGEVRT